MHILYVDDSGSVSNPNEKIFILGGISVFERGIYHQIMATDNCVASFGIGPVADIELHGSPMYNGGDGIWRTVRSRAAREQMIRSALATLGPGNRSIRLFAIAIDRVAASPRDPVELAFEEICNRFNLFLQRTGDRMNERQRGLLVMDESKYEKPLQALARHFRINGGRWGHFRNLAEVPLFVNSKSSRLVQMADLVAWATWRKFEHQDGRFFDPLIPMFDSDGGVIHGLVHYRDRAEECFCPGCVTRNRRDSDDRVRPLPLIS
jgi:hypothetical protein